MGKSHSGKTSVGLVDDLNVICGGNLLHSPRSMCLLPRLLKNRQFSQVAGKGTDGSNSLILRYC